MKVDCPQCQHSAVFAFEITDKNRAAGPDSFSYYCCSTCKLLFLRPIPPDLGRYYPDNYYPIPSSVQQLRQSAQIDEFKIDMIRRFVPEGRLLEIGSSYGGFAFLAKDAGYQVDVIEMSAACCECLRTVAQVNAIQSDNPISAMQKLGSYDVIAMWHVIEHLPDPWEVLEHAACHLSPGGILIIAAPNPQSLQFRLFGKNWMHLDAPRHLQLIPLSCLLERLRSCGLDEVDLTTTDPHTRIMNGQSWLSSMAHISSNRIARGCLIRLRPAIQRLLGPMELKGLNGSAYTLIARKERESVVVGTSDASTQVSAAR